MITMQQIDGSTIREVSKGQGIGYHTVTYVVDEFPRLRRRVKYPAELTWLVDGEPVESLEAAVEALNTPPRFTKKQLNVMRWLSAETPYSAIYPLVLKGAVVADGKGVRELTDIGRAALDSCSCRWCGFTEIRAIMDDEPLCQECCDEWVRGNG